MEPDDNIAVDDEGYDTNSAGTSYVTSIASEIRNGIEEYGRRWASYGKHFYGLPIDDAEQDRNDLQHYKFFLMYEGRLHLAPIDPQPQNILDLGTGSGIWAIEAADLYPSARVIGVDIAAVQPSWVSPNCQFEILDVETSWEFRRNSFDLIHAREFLFAIRDWPALISQAYDHLRPGGYFELAVTVPEVGCDDGTCPPDSQYAELGKIFFQIAEAMGLDGNASRLWKDQLLARGFEDVHETVFKMPTNDWPKDRRMKTIGKLEMQNFFQYAQAGFERGATALLGMDRAQLAVMLAHTRREILDRNIHTYVKFVNVYGRKPGP
ncbi:hypothetical protein G647_05593 [Cladophialophora carrionii CBS 160.54]|uniref:Methyltransferase domain-containing protein n=1 Tax=Cladophialophora carrionii CBS 160.54 TaxID=1279043 RepID=V9DCU8_9EURO|nr:uncharacterized protein G647_05593 [Cladophialophora carrionii CBS 160.54]ETI23787.1 hypothetical protein G647_05593 [Cladophialophora carrionii CBS 160.54]